MTTIPATAARRDFFKLLKGATEGHQTFRIRDKRSTAVLMSEEDYDSLIETLELAAIPGFRASMKRSIRQLERGDVFSMEEVFGEKP